MSVLLETTAGNLVIDVLDGKLGYNFLKLCKLKYFFFCPFIELSDATISCGLVQYPDAIQHSIGDLTGADEINISDLDQSVSDGAVGTVYFNPDESVIRSKFTITLSPQECKYQFGKVAEGFNTLLKITKNVGDVRIINTIIIDDPFHDPVNLKSLIPKEQYPNEKQLRSMNFPDLKNNTTIEALTLELIGDLSHHDVKPQPNILFITKLNPITDEDSLEIIFSRFGTVKQCNIIKDKDGKSKRYGFIEFETIKQAEIAYEKLHDNCIIDGNEVIVDFSQSTRKQVI